MRGLFVKLDPAGQLADLAARYGIDTRRLGFGSPLLRPSCDLMVDLPHETLSIVVPVYNEEENLPELARRLREAATEMRIASAEVILVSDGSRDRTEQMIAELVAENPLFRGIFLTRNFGHQAAVSVGLEEATGSIIVVIDGDLQDPPEAISELLEAIEAGADVAYAVRTKRKEHAVKRLAYYAFYRLLRRISAIDVPLDTGDFCCMRRRVVDAMLELPERNRFVRGIRAWVGYRQVGVPYERAARFAGEPKYNLRRLMGLAYDGLFSFSSMPIRIMQGLGFAVSGFALAVAVGYFLWHAFTPERFPSGFATLAISIWFLAGVQLLFLGLVGEYVVRTFDETRKRPVALVRQRLAHPAATAPMRKPRANTTDDADLAAGGGVR